MGLMSHMGSKSVYEGPSVGRITFGPMPPPSTAEREVMANRKDPRRFQPAVSVRTIAEFCVPYPSNPDPIRFVVERFERVGSSLILMVRYPGCTTYEGRKVLLLADARMEDVHGCTLLDPHFTDQAPRGALVPVARFEPTERGWKLARVCAAAL